MPTYIEVIQRVGLECLNRTDLDVEIKSGIQQTIRHYQNKRFWFNETLSTLACVVSVETIAVPSDFLFIQELMVTQNSATTALIQSDFDFIRQLNIDTSTGLPTRYAKYGPRFYLSNIPDSAYAVPCYYIHRLPALSANSDTNKWLSAAEDMVTYGAAKFVSAAIGNVDNAVKFANLEKVFYDDLCGLRDQSFHNRLRLTKF